MSETSENENNPYKFFLNGVFMGLADIIPGVSGGTIALILGIYERLISAIKSIDLKFIPFFFLSPFDRGYLERAKDNFLSIDLLFLIPLAVGIGSAFFGASYVILPVLKEYPGFIHAFFFGLILMSAKHVYGRTKKLGFRVLLPGVFGFIFAFFFVGLEGLGMSHTLPIIFISGLLAICAMMLPGISGSFIVYVLGQYKYLLGVLQSIIDRWIEAGVFVAGLLISLFSFSRVISYFLEKYHSGTLFFLTGLMIGALRKPFEEILEATGPSTNIFTLFGIFLCGFIGVFIVLMLERNENQNDG